MARLIKLTFLGDMLCEREQIAMIKKNNSHYGVIFDQVKHLWRDSDYVIGNLETPVAGRKLRYTYEKMRFNAPDAFAEAAKKSGVDFVSLANNHMLDRGVEGLNRTLGTLDRIGLEHSGAFRTESESERIFIKEISGVKFALLSCTYGCNQGLSCNFLNDDEFWRVEILKRPQAQITTMAFLARRFFSNLLPLPVKQFLSRGKHPSLPIEEDSVEVEDFEKPEHQILMDRFLAKIRRARQQADVVIVLAHIGGQYNSTPGAWQQKATQAFVDAGANLVIANHAHVPLGVERDDDRLVAHCLGNFCFMPTDATHRHGRADYSVLLNCWFDSETKRLARQEYVLLKTLIRGDGVAVPVPTKERWLDWRC